MAHGHAHAHGRGPCLGVQAHVWLVTDEVHYKISHLYVSILEDHGHPFELAWDIELQVCCCQLPDWLENQLARQAVKQLLRIVFDPDDLVPSPRQSRANSRGFPGASASSATLTV